MRKTRAKQLRMIAAFYANPVSKGLLHQGKIELFQDKEKKEEGTSAPWFIRIFQRRFAGDSMRSLYRRNKKNYVSGTIDAKKVKATIVWINTIIRGKYAHN